MQSYLLPPIWLIVLLAGIGQFSETVYSPSLPTIAESLAVEAKWIEYTLTIYLCSFGIGTLFWGRLSDHFGRKPCVLAGLAIYILGSLGCYLSDSWTLLMISRFVQGFGGSIGSVLAQAICRDAFSGPALGKAYSSIMGALAFFPAIGPIIGGIIIQNSSWPMIFALLVCFGIAIFLTTIKTLPETLSTKHQQLPSILNIFCQLAKDKKVIGLGLIVAISNGITFSYYAEGPFYIIELLGLTPSQYGSTFVLMATSMIIGSFISRKMQNHVKPLAIMRYGLWPIVCANAMFCLGVLLKDFYLFSKMQLLALTITTMTINMAGICMITSNALAISLQDYRHAIGTASSLFGFYYYLGISLCTLGIGLLHDGTLLSMPLYFFSLSVLMVTILNLTSKTFSESRQ